MARLIFSAITSLDGYIEDPDGGFDWAAPDEEVHRFVNELERPVGTYLLGRRMYDTMRFWETAQIEPDQTEPELAPYALDFAAIWRAADKVVYSRTLAEPTSERTRIEREFDPDGVRRLKADADRDLTIGGPEIAAVALKAGLVDEVQLFVNPVTVGGGKSALPGGVHLELREHRRFGNSVVFLRYDVRP